jgi:aconitate hydratase 2/2-methylisocitrate dehydratase
VPLRPGDGIIHSWLNRMLLPDTVGTGGDSYTRFPIGNSFPGRLRSGGFRCCQRHAAGHARRVRAGALQRRHAACITPLRDLSMRSRCGYQGRSADGGQTGKRNIFFFVASLKSVTNLKVEQASELSDASAERSAGGCTVHLNKEPIIEYITSNITMLKWDDRHRLFGCAPSTAASRR